MKEHQHRLIQNGYVEIEDGDPMTSSRSLSPGLEDVRQYTVDVAMEIVNNYDIDGLHLDYVRWNEHSSGSFNILPPGQIEGNQNDRWYDS